ncbi:MAG: transporter ATP-binding protein [Clostridiales bacterium]|nr:transporter ATP-binding protein [Clostridiales bacterium]
MAVKGKTTVVFSTHILSDVERICDQVAVLHNGKLALSGSLTEVKESRRNDSISLEFTSNQDAENMALVIKKIQMVKEIEQIGNALTVKVSNLREAGKLIIDLISQKGIFITRYEVLEPSLESLFMEVVK